MGSVDRTSVLVVELARGIVCGFVVYGGDFTQAVDRIRAVGLRADGIAARHGRGRRCVVPTAAIYAVAAFLSRFFNFDFRHFVEYHFLF